jgi:nucleoid DNA-binding protein
MDEQQIEKISDRIKEQLLAGESVHLDGIGTFSRVHEPQHFSRDEKGRTVAHPPKDTVHFSPEDLGEAE